MGFSVLVFSVLDVKVGCFSQPVFFKTEALAVRSFTAAVREGNSDLSRFSEDYSLFELGSFDEEKGVFMNNRAPRQVVTASVCKVVVGGVVGENG